MNSQAPVRRSSCPVASTLDLVGDRWTLLVLRDLFGGKRRFDEFLGSPEAIATNILSERLARLERERLVVRARDPDDGRRILYELTARGRSLQPVLVALRDWGLVNIEGTNTLQFAALRASGAARRTRAVAAQPARRKPRSAAKGPLPGKARR
jgi:DNA-binding HxlR family transcriptional regulator